MNISDGGTTIAFASNFVITTVFEILVFKFFIQKILNSFKLLQYGNNFKLISCRQLSSNYNADSDIKRNTKDVTKKRNEIQEIVSNKKCV